MKVSLTLFAVLFPLHFVDADGFRCETRHTHIRVRVVNHRDPRLGTRSPEFMTLSDPLQPEIAASASFFSANRTLHYQGAGRYLGQVDLRSTRPELRTIFIAGTRLRDLASILLDLEFSYDPDVVQLANAVPELPGRIYYHRRRGDTLEEPVSCTRFQGDGGLRVPVH
jgi:hypothetical protein